MLTVITGPMFAGKSSKIISIRNANYVAGNKCALFKPGNDNRYSDYEIATHDGKRVVVSAVLDSKSTKDVIDFVEIGIDVFIFDEAQFFDPQFIIEVVEELLYKHKKDVVIAGLSQDSDGKPFGAMPYLLAIADDIVHLKSVCAKNKTIGTATRTYRKDKNNKNQVAVGGAELYEPRSFDAWLESK